MEAGDTHPLILQLRPVFTELRHSTAETLPSAIFKLEYIIDEEKDALFHRGAMRASSAAITRNFPAWLNQQLCDLFDRPETCIAGIQAVRVLIGVEYVELNEMTRLFSDLLMRCVVATREYEVGRAAADVWGMLLSNGSSIVESIIEDSLAFSIALLTSDRLAGAVRDVAKGRHEQRSEATRRGGGGGSALTSSGKSRSEADLHATAAPGNMTSAEVSGVEGQVACESRNWRACSSPNVTRLSGTLFLLELITRVPAAVVPQIDRIFAALQHATTDCDRRVRTCAVEVLYHALRVAYRASDSAFCAAWQDAFMTSIVTALATPDDTTTLHAALLTFNALLRSVTTRPSEGRVAGLSATGARGVRQVWGFINDRLSHPREDAEVWHEALNALPLLASYDRAAFTQTTVARLRAVALEVLTSTAGATSPDERTAIFVVLGQLAHVLPELVPRFLARMIQHIESSLVPRPYRDRCPAAVTCFAMVSEVRPDAVRPYLHHLLTPLFASSVTEGFARDVAKLCTAFPELRSTCLSRMLEAAKQQLLAARHQSDEVPDGAAMSGMGRRHHTILAQLTALGSLDFTGYSTLQFLCDAVVQYVCDPNEEVRRRAIDLCFKLVFSGCTQSPCQRTNAGVIIHHGRDHIRLVNIVVTQLVNAAVTDPASDIRLHTLERFGAAFDSTLSLQEIAQSLYPALHDKQQNRVVATRLLGRLSRRNPGYVYPMLRTVMLQCVTEVAYFDFPKVQEQATLVLSALVESAPDMMRPYIPALLRSCAARLQDDAQDVPVLTALLSCLGKLARYAEGEDVAVVAAIRPYVVAHILDSANIAKKLEAVRALTDIIRTTKDVNVYEVHPELLPVLLAALHGGFKETWKVRQDVLKLMGVIGAVDPVRVKEICRGLRDKGMEASTVRDTATAGGGGGPLVGAPRGEEAIASGVVKQVLHVLQLPSLTDEQCLSAVHVVVNVFTLKEETNECLSSFYGELLAVVLQHTQTRSKIREKLLDLMTSMVHTFGLHVRQHVNTLLPAVMKFLPASELSVLIAVLRLLVKLRYTLREEFRLWLPALLQPIMATLLADPVRLGEPVFAFMIAMGSLLDEHLHTVLPCVCDIAVTTAYPIACRVRAVDALSHFARQLPHLVYHASRCVHCLCAILVELAPLQGWRGLPTTPAAAASSDAPVVLIAITLDAIREVARSLGADFAKFAHVAYAAVEPYGKEGREVRGYLQTMLRRTRRVTTPHFLLVDPVHCDGGREDEAEEAHYARLGVPASVLALRDNGGATTTPYTSGATRGTCSLEQMQQLRNILDIRERVTEEDWNLWLKQLAVELLRLSPSPSHGFAHALAQIHEPFARHMLHSAFSVCYGKMSSRTKDMVTRLLGDVLRSPHVPTEVLHELLNLAEYMERLAMRFNPKDTVHRNYAGLLFDLHTLTESSERCNSYSKAVHYVEIQFYELTREFERGVMRGRPVALPPDKWRLLVQLCEKSIFLCNLLGQRESAEGVLKYIQLNFTLLTGRQASEMPSMMDAQLFEKLQWWSQSLRAYQQRLRVEPECVSNIVGYMRSLDNLGDHGRVLGAWKAYAPRLSKRDATELAPYGAHAAWLLRRWDDMATITQSMSDEGYIGTTAIFYRAVTAVHQGLFHEAEPLIQLCRKRLDSTLSALVAESYDRAYHIFVGIQQLSELDEFAFVVNHRHELRHWQSLWEKRLTAMAFEGWAGTLANHTLAVPPTKELNMWLQFVALSRLYTRERTSLEVLYELLGSQTIGDALEQQVLPQPAIALAAFQHLHDTHARGEAIGLLDRYVAKVEKGDLTQLTRRSRAMFALCHAKLADWLFAQLQEEEQQHAQQQQQQQQRLLMSARASCVLGHLQRATALDASNGTIWHTLARLHHELVPKTDPGEVAAHTEYTEFIVSAMHGYVRSVRLSQELEDVLGFLSLWFLYGSLPRVQSNTALQAEILQVSPTVWLKVIPQIIARIHSSDAAMAESVFHLLVNIGKAHPQALLYSLNVTNTSVQLDAAEDNPEQHARKRAAQRVLNKIVEMHHHHGSVLVTDAALVCQELVRCAVLWVELWFDELERAWYQWGKDRNARNVLTLLQPLLQQMKQPETMAELHFVGEFGELLHGACEAVAKAASLNNAAYMEDAWNRFKTAVKCMDEQISGMSSLELQFVSPRLMQSGRNLSLVVPGQYDESGQFPRIACFQSTLKVMNSKQHPRRLYVNGTDGAVYKFLLKGHEDLRLDERVMQLLAFVNTLLAKHAAIQRRDGMIQIYSVTPLSDNAGLVGWVDHCDTLHQLIKEYRVYSKYLSVEINLMRSFNVDLDRLTTMQHVETFEFALEQTDGNDLANSLWMRASSAESWLDHRTTYVSSLATMSMVGHILGLGDRHPSNLMIHAFSGRVVHIDFGDCFEVAKTRPSYPEKVPFRLTRMLVKAMEMGGIEGLYRHGCITVMSILREEGSSILALLEAFVHDPLVSWWRDEQDEMEGTDTSASAVGDDSLRVAYYAMAESFHKRQTIAGSVHTIPRISVLAGRSVAKANAAACVLDRTSGNDNSARQASKAQKVVRRIKEKLEGRESVHSTAALSSMHNEMAEGLKVEVQVSRLIEEAMSHENLCVQFQGWCPFW